MDFKRPVTSTHALLRTEKEKYRRRAGRTKRNGRKKMEKKK